MSASLLKKILIAVFLVAFIILLGSFNVSKPRIMVLHSFSKTSPWCIDVDSGISKVLKKNRLPVSTKWHYLNLDTDMRAGFQEKSVNDAQKAIKLFDPDLLIAVDDESNKFVTSGYTGKAGPKILFVSILQSPSDYGYAGAGNVSGIVEQLPLDAVRDALLTARKDVPARIAVLAMDDVTGRAELAQVRAFNWSPHQVTAFLAANSFAEWQRFTLQSADQTDVLLVLSYGGIERGNGDHKVLEREKVVDWLERNSKMLPVGMSERYAEDGGGLSITPAPTDFGEKAMQMALKWVAAAKGSPPPPVISSPHFKVGVRKSLLSARGIEMPTIYIEAARTGDAYFP